MKIDYTNATKLIGKRIKITGTGSGHTYGPIGTTVKVVRVSGVDQRTLMLNSRGTYIGWNDFTVEPATREEILTDVEGLDKDIKDLRAKLAFMDELKLSTYDETEFKVYSVLQELNTSSSDIEKAKVIAKLINQ